jgi:hypothetical protein
MALAYALQTLNADPTLRLTNYGEFLALHPAEWEVEIHDGSSWSCFHGVERWRSDCGCRCRSDWHQRWRAPLRRGLDSLKKYLDAVYEEHGARLLADAWPARDAYIEVVLRRGDEVHPARPSGPGAAARAEARGAVADFLAAHGRPGVRPSEALALLEMQRNALLMFTSCGWFFDEISGIETLQCLRYAARALQLAGHFADVAAVEEELLAGLESAPSNLPEVADGRAVWEQFVRPARVDLERVLAHHAVTSLFRPPGPCERLYCYEVESLEHEVTACPALTVAVGRLHARSTLTLEEDETAFVALHRGGLDFHTVLSRDVSPGAYAAFKRRLGAALKEGQPAGLAALVAAEFPGHAFRLEDLFADELRRVLDVVLQGRLEEYLSTFARLAAKDADVLDRLGRMRGPLPGPMRGAASVVLDHRLSEEIHRRRGDESLRALREEVERAAVWGYRPERGRLQKELGEELRKVLQELRPGADLAGPAGRASWLLDAAALLGVRPDLWETQNQLLETYARLADAGSLTPALHETLARVADRLHVSEGLLGWKP